MGKNRKKQIKSVRIKRFRKWDHQAKGRLNTGPMSTPPSPSETLPTRDAMSALWNGEFRQCIELFNRREIHYANGKRTWLVWRQSTYIFMEENFYVRQRRFSIMFGSEERALSYTSNIIWKESIPMDDTRITNDRIVQSPRLWKVPRHPPAQQLPHD
jgi:hypothetical protein